jgi:hypothetical protein
VTHECKAETRSGAKGSETEVEDEIDFQVYASDDDGICIKVKYEQDIEDEAADMEQETEASFKVCFQQLLEYSKEEGSSEEAYGWSEGDTIHQTFDLTNWADFGEGLTDSSDGMSTFDVTSNDGIITMTFTIMPVGDDEQITANSIKADVRIVHFPWTQSNSYVALFLDVESELEVDIDQEEDDELDTIVDAGQDEPIDDQPEPTTSTEDEALPTTDEEWPMDGGMRRSLDSKPIKPKDVTVSFSDIVNSVGLSPFGTVAWATTAVAATATNDTDVVAVGRAEKIIQVVATSPPAGSQRRLQDGSSREQIAFSFIGDGAQGSPDIFWDPKAGIDYMRSATSSVGAFSSSLSIIGGLIGTFLVLFA